MVKPVDMGLLSQKVREDLERVPFDREALQRDLTEIKKAVVLQQPLLGDSAFKSLTENALKDIVKNIMDDLSSNPSLYQQSPSPALTDGDFVSALSGGNALYATVLGLDETSPFRKAQLPFLRKLDNVEMLQPMMGFQESKFSCIDRQSSSRFHELVQSFGYSVAGSLNFSNVFSLSSSYASNSKSRHYSGQTSESEKIYLHKVGFYPVGAFRLPLNDLKLSEEAHSDLLKVTNESQAENYLRRYGSHVSTDLHHYGGLMVYHTEVQRTRDRHLSEDIAAAEQKFEATASGGFWKIQAGAAGGYHSSSSDYTTSEESKEKVGISVQLQTYGPVTSNSALFQEILKRDRKTNYLIDKGSPQVLRPVWEIARTSEDPKIQNASDILFQAWMKKTHRIANIMIAEFREQYLERIQSDCQSKLLPKGKCKMLLNTADDEDDEDVKTLENDIEAEIEVTTKSADEAGFLKVDKDAVSKSNEELLRSSSECVVPRLSSLLEQLQKINENSARRRLGTVASNQIDDKIFVKDYPPTVEESLEYNLLHRLNLEATTIIAAASTSGSGRKRGSKASEKTKIAKFDIPSLFKMYPLHECANIVQLLLERRYAIPIIPDLLKNVGLLRVVRRTELDPFLSDDKKLLRVAIVSYADKQLSKTSLLLKDLFHVSSSLSKEHYDMYEAEVGQGTILAGNESISCIVLHVLGPFAGMWDVIIKFADYLIIEEPYTQNFDDLSSIIDKYNNLTSLPNFVTAWIPSEGSLECYDEQTPFLFVKGSLKELIKQVSDDIVDEFKSGMNHHYCLTDLLNLPFDAKTQLLLKSIISDLKYLDSYRVKIFQLEKSFKEEGRLEAKLRDFQKKNNPSEREKLENRIVQERKRRTEHAGRTEKEPLIQLLLNCLSIENVEERILALRAMEDAIASNITESEKVKEQNRAYSSLEAEYRDIVQAKGLHDPDAVSKREKVLKAKEERNNSILSIDHVWREASLLYCARPGKFQHLPKKAASCLASGIPLELFNGDANMLNVEWIKRVLESLKDILPNKRIFVLSVLGEQSCGKSTLLNAMFGIRFRTSVGRCTNGLMMTLIKSEHRSEYDYVLVLDTEGIRSPEHWGLPGCEKRDNLIASLAILPSDATILMVKGESDNALKDILPVVLMAYRGSLLAKKELGTLSSRFFVVYNQVIVTQKEKLESIIQSLSTSLIESFSAVREIAGNCINVRAQFSAVSSTENSDVCVLGCVNDGEPPKDVPNFNFSKQVMSFREHIHRSIVQTPGWKPRQIGHFSEDIGLVWQSVQSAEFELSYLSLKERSNYCRLHEAVEKMEKDFHEKYESAYKDVCSEKREKVDNDEELKEVLDATTARLRNLMSDHVAEFNKEVEKLLNEENYQKWETDIKDRTNNFLDSTKGQWHHSLELVLRNELYFEKRLGDYQREMRNKMNKLFKTKKMNPTNDIQFEMLFQEMLQRAEEENPPVNVEGKVRDVYLNNLKMKTLDADLIDSTNEEKHDATWITKLGKMLAKPAKWISGFPLEMLVNLRKVAKTDNKLPENKLLNCLNRTVYKKLEGIQYYSNTVVQDIIEEADKIISRDKAVKSKKEQNDWHKFVRRLLTQELKLVQAKWEESNSIHARLKTKKAEMKQLYSDISTGLQNMDRLNSKLQYFFREITSKAFRKELQEEISRSVKKKRWYENPHYLQGHLDLFLMEVEESSGVHRVLDWINNPQELRRRTVLSLIEKEIKDTEVKWKSFKDRTEQCICSAYEISKKLEGCKAIAFINMELPNLLGDVFQCNFFKQELISQFQVAFDESEFEGTNPEFSQLQLKPIVKALHSREATIDEKELASEVFQILKEQTTDKVTVCALCEERCELCKGLCFRKRMHDGVRHDACHQPGGLAGCHFVNSDALTALACNTIPLDYSFRFDNDWHKFYDYSKVFGSWVQPDREASLSDYRQYLIHKYNHEIARYFCKNPSTDIPAHYEKDFNRIRDDIKCRVSYFDDYPNS